MTMKRLRPMYAAATELTMSATLMDQMAEILPTFAASSVRWSGVKTSSAPSSQ